MINIDARSSKPIYEQIVDGIKENVIRGVLLPGQRIPSIREMSKLITANPNTVSKAYSELERQKVIETITGRGTFISANLFPRADEEKIQKLKKKLNDLIIEAHYLGLDQSSISKLVDEIYKGIERG